MTKKDEEFRRHLLSTFRIEAGDHIKTLTSGLLELEKGLSSDKYVAVLETIYRSAHSLKGAARAVTLPDIESLCQSLETVFSAMKQKSIMLSPELFDALHAAVGVIDSLLSSPEAEGVTRLSEIIQKINRLQRKEQGVILKKEDLVSPAGKTGQTPFSKGKSTEDEVRKPLAEKSAAVLTEQAEKAEPGQFLQSLTETIRIAVPKLNALLLEAEELLSPKQAARQCAAEFLGLRTMISSYRQERAKIKTEMRLKSRETDKLAEFIDWTDMYMKTLEARLASMAKETENNSRSLGRLVDDIIGNTKKALQRPFSVILDVLPKMVRDLAKDTGKEIELVLKGVEVEIDNRILEEMKDPLIHLVRNSIDHGLEKPDERAANKKQRKGTIVLAVSQESDGKVNLVVSDDGKGLDLDKIKKAAVREGLISEEDAFTEQDAVSMIFHSGISTSPIITDISGRGLGLAIVQEKVDKLGGSVSVENRPLEGTLFRLVLPSSIATFRGLVITIAEQVFVLPLSRVERVTRVRKEDILTVENRETINLGGKTLSFVWMEDVLGSSRRAGRQAKEEVKDDFINVVVMATAGKCIAFGIDEVVSEQEVLVRSLGRQLSRVRNIAGATILGTGRVVPILNTVDLNISAIKAAGSPAITGKMEETGMEPAKRKHILVVEDSITSRMLLRNILEAAGYYVKTAVDGIDGFTALRTGDFDLVVSDVEMPRMNGFELTATIRSDRKFTDLPVVLVTALDSRSDRERGIDAGANAYIVKSSFDQSNLLDAVKRLL